MTHEFPLRKSKSQYHVQITTFEIEVRGSWQISGPAFDKDVPEEVKKLLSDETVEQVVIRKTTGARVYSRIGR